MAGGQHRTRVVARRDLGRIRHSLHFNRWAAVFYGPVFFGAVPELPVSVPAPAIDMAARKHHARVIAARCELGRVRQPLDFDRGAAARVGPIPQLRVSIPAPAIDVAARAQHARVIAAPGEAHRIRRGGGARTRSAHERGQHEKYTQDAHHTTSPAVVDLPPGVEDERLYRLAQLLALRRLEVGLERFSTARRVFFFTHLPCSRFWPRLHFGTFLQRSASAPSVSSLRSVSG